MGSRGFGCRLLQFQISYKVLAARRISRSYVAGALKIFLSRNLLNCELETSKLPLKEPKTLNPHTYETLYSTLKATLEAIVKDSYAQLASKLSKAWQGASGRATRGFGFRVGFPS